MVWMMSTTFILSYYINGSGQRQWTDGFFAHFLAEPYAVCGYEFHWARTGVEEVERSSRKQRKGEINLLTICGAQFSILGSRPLGASYYVLLLFLALGCWWGKLYRTTLDLPNPPFPTHLTITLLSLLSTKHGTGGAIKSQNNSAPATSFELTPTKTWVSSMHTGLPLSGVIWW